MAEALRKPSSATMSGSAPIPNPAAALAADDYNTVHLHSQLGYHSPGEYILSQPGTCPGSTLVAALAKMVSADFVQTKGLGVALCSARSALMAACRSAIERNTPRRMRCRVIFEKKFSTALSQEGEVGVKWKVQRGWGASQARTLGCLWVA